eukprot:TRINITY_DN1426_c0_g6_i1.p1 TRINITY_DN1426_c0_g6~~TRINITY_DN1426_c0_g6_i1.p1  ORF type:complete len:523 (+),score=154.00 TRINITY_DN1426_c0_g6_i1:67-1569(+)
MAAPPPAPLDPALLDASGSASGAPAASPPAAAEENDEDVPPPAEEEYEPPADFVAGAVPPPAEPQELLLPPVETAPARPRSGSARVGSLGPQRSPGAGRSPPGRLRDPGGALMEAAGGEAREKLRRGVELSELRASEGGSRRIDRCNGFAYTRAEFVESYGAEEGASRWDWAAGGTTELTAEESLPPDGLLRAEHAASRVQLTATGEVRVAAVAPGGFRWVAVPDSEMTPGEAAYRDWCLTSAPPASTARRGLSPVVPSQNLPDAEEALGARFQVAESGEVVAAAQRDGGAAAWQLIPRGEWTAPERAYAARVAAAVPWDELLWGPVPEHRPSDGEAPLGSAVAEDIGAAYRRAAANSRARYDAARSRLASGRPHPPPPPVLLRVTRISADEPLGLQLSGLRIAAVNPGGAAARAGAARYRGGLITHVNGLSVREPAEVGKASAAWTGDDFGVTLRIEMTPLPQQPQQQQSQRGTTEAAASQFRLGLSPSPARLSFRPSP